MLAVEKGKKQLFGITLSHLLFYRANGWEKRGPDSKLKN